MERSVKSGMPPALENPSSERWHLTPGVKLLVISSLVLLGLVPLFLIRDLLSERRVRHQEAIQNITSTWGRSQTVAGPVLVVPYYRYTKVWKEVPAAGKTERLETVEKELARACFLPEELTVTGDLQTQKLHRSIYEAVVYRSALEISGRFSPLSLADWKVAEADVLWNEAALMMSITDLRGANQTLWLRWGNERLELAPGSTFPGLGPVVQARPPGLATNTGPLSFQLTLNLNGSGALWFAPFGLQNRVRLTSLFPDPSFQGAFLPIRREVTANGFEADWEVSYYGRGYPQRWSDHDMDPLGGDALRSSLFGVAVVPAVDSYRLVERSIKYGILFLALVFSGFFLFEMWWLVRVHPVQYTLVGAALCLFYLALLSLSEVVSFGLAYWIGAGASIVLVAVYSAFLLRAATRAWLVAGGLGAIYGYMYIILRQQDYALLYGTAALFVVLAVAMYATRNINGHGKREAPPTANQLLPSAGE